MKLGRHLIRFALSILMLILLSGCPVINTLITNPRALEPRYNYSQNDLEIYNSWVEETLHESSQQGTSAILVNKSAYRLYLIRNGKVESVYPIDLGFNPIDDKLVEGDGCTPEGMYVIQRKLNLGQTAFYKAFLIDYPNSHDRELGKTGGLIEIHGSGTGMTKLQGGYNWTLGCVALADQEMDVLFSQMKKGNRITIVRYTNRRICSVNESSDL